MQQRMEEWQWLCVVYDRKNITNKQNIIIYVYKGSGSETTKYFTDLSACF